MKVLLLGVGMQGKAALTDLIQAESVTEIIAADQDYEGLIEFASTLHRSDLIQCLPLDATDLERVSQLMDQGVDVVIDLLPVDHNPDIALIAVDHGLHLVNASYAGPDTQLLDRKAKSLGVTILPEFGLDPGIDQVMLGETVRTFDQIEEIKSYGAGLPESSAADNPLKYKVSWSFEGVLRSYVRDARLVSEGQVVHITGTHLFYPENIHLVEIEELGRLEAFPNGDALSLATELGLDLGELRNLGRYTLRWPGHCALWRALVALHLLSNEPVDVDGVSVDRIRYLATAIEPHIQYNPDERDIALVRVEVTGLKGSRKERVVLQVLDWMDTESGLSAMSRTVGFTASIGAQLIARGQITKRGVLSPLTDIPLSLLSEELKERDIEISVASSDVTG